MSHLTTTATSTYVLTKYSKSHPSSRPNSPEWQHFTNPSLQLVLDVKKGVELESVRLRVIWSMDSSTTATAEQREVVFEDIDLFHLSCLQHPSVQKHLPQTHPLKAVYRDAVVGIRYFHGPEPTLEPVYRRFQVTFLSSSTALEFIDTIRPICPCRANPGPFPSSNINSHTTMPDSTPAPSNSYPGILTRPQLSIPSTPSSATFTAGSGSRVSFTSSQGLVASSQHSIYTSSPLNPDNTTSTTFAVPILPIPATNFSARIVRSSEQGMSNSQSQPSLADSVSRTNRQSLPSSPGQMSSRNQSNCDNNQSLVTAPSKDDIPTTFLSLLRETTVIYDFSQSALEQLVGEVIREEGFVKLLENLGALWQVKSLTQ